MTQKPKLHLLYTDVRQLRLNCFIAQLYETLSENFSLSLTSLKQLRDGDYNQPRRGEQVLSVLKQRTWQSVIPFLGRFCEKSGLIVYDQDPWESYHDKARCPGIYKRLNDLVNVKQFLVTSGWWANHIRNTDNLPVSFVRMGVLGRNCNAGADFAARVHRLGFQGSLHGHRAKFYQFLRESGQDVSCLPPVPYKDFLTSVQNIGVFVHDEHADICIDGVLSYNGIWIKDIEVAARGCFAVRNTDLDMNFYDIDELPTIFSYATKEEAINVLERIQLIPDKEKDQMVQETVNRIRERNDWMTVVNVILAHQ